MIKTMTSHSYKNWIAKNKYPILRTVIKLRMGLRIRIHLLFKGVRKIIRKDRKLGRILKGPIYTMLSDMHIFNNLCYNLCFFAF